MRLDKIIFKVLFKIILYFNLKILKICTDEPKTDKLVELLKTLGMIPLQKGFFKFHSESNKNSKKPKSGIYYYEVLLNGKPIGHVDSNQIEHLTSKLRYLKALATSQNKESDQILSKYIEICHVPKINLENCNYNLYPGLYIFTNSGRMMRPVVNLTTNNVEYIGTMEQCYLHVCIKPEEFIENVNIL